MYSLQQKSEKKEPSYDLNWVYSHFFTWMNLLGIGLNSSTLNCRLYGLLLLVIGLWSSTYSFVKLCRDLLDKPRLLNAKTMTIAWNILIDYGNHFLFDILSHIILFAWLPKSWPKLWKTLKKLNKGLNHHQHMDYQRIRHFILIGGIFLITFVSNRLRTINDCVKLWSCLITAYRLSHIHINQYYTVI